VHDTGVLVGVGGKKKNCERAAWKGKVWPPSGILGPRTRDGRPRSRGARGHWAACTGVFVFFFRAPVAMSMPGA